MSDTRVRASESAGTAPATPATRTVRTGVIDAARRRSWESVMAVSSGRIATRGLSEVVDTPSWPATYAAGVYTPGSGLGGTVPTLLPGPLWATVDLQPDDGWCETAELDLTTATVTQRFARPATDDVVVAERFATLGPDSSDAGGVTINVLVVDGPAPMVVDAPPLLAPQASPSGRPPGWAPPVAVDGPDHVHGDTVELSCLGGTDEIVARASQRIADRPAPAGGTESARRRLVRIVAVDAGPRPESPRQQDRRGRVRAALHRAVERGVDELRATHRERWRRRWERAATTIGDADIDLGVATAWYHLLSAAAGDECAVGARGLTGGAYRGHVFWDTDVFVTPALAAIDPAAARSTLCYRSADADDFLDAARRRARSSGHAGAHFPWESADTGDDVTPARVKDLRGRTIEVLTGRFEEHITADVAWAVDVYHRWSGDDAFMAAMGLEILVETARYWASRIELDDHARGHIRDVIGPDEYHERVDDNAFTNRMAAHNLRVAARHAEPSGAVPTGESRRWRDLADALVDGWDETLGVHEQFAGYHALRPLLADSLADAPVAADALLGHEAVQRTQLIKQPDVLMLHHMIPDGLRPGSLAADLAFYEPRTAHGSSLSPAIHAGLHARSGQPALADHWFRYAARLDLDDLSGTTAGGFHLATAGGLWQALTHGVLGVRLLDDALLVDPSVPDSWGAVVHRFLVRRAPVELIVTGDRTTVRCRDEVTVASPAAGAVTAQSHDFVRTTGGWERR